MRYLRKCRFLFSHVPVVMLLVACSNPQTPEERVRAFIAEMADSVEQRSWMSFDVYVSDKYRDGRGLDKGAAIAIVTRYILANQQIYLLQRVPVVQVDMPSPMRATAVVYAAIAGQPIVQAEDLSRIEADVYRFEIALAENADGDLQVTRGDWQSVPMASFLLGN